MRTAGSRPTVAQRWRDTARTTIGDRRVTDSRGAARTSAIRDTRVTDGCWPWRARAAGPGHWTVQRRLNYQKRHTNDSGP